MSTHKKHLRSNNDNKKGRTHPIPHPTEQRRGGKKEEKEKTNCILLLHSEFLALR